MTGTTMTLTGVCDFYDEATDSYCIFVGKVTATRDPGRPTVAWWTCPVCGRKRMAPWQPRIEVGQVWEHRRYGFRVVVTRIDWPLIHDRAVLTGVAGSKFASAFRAEYTLVEETAETAHPYGGDE